MNNTPYDKVLSNYMMSALTGFVFLESPYMMIRGKTKVVKLTRRWKPKRIKRITEVKPNPEVMVMGNTIMGHPVTIAALKRKVLV